MPDMLGSRICLQLCIPAAIAYTQKTSDKADADVSYRGLGHGHYQHDRHGHHKRHILKRDGQGISLLGSSTTNTSASSASLNISAGANTITEQTEGSTTNISSGTCPNGTAYTEFTDNFVGGTRPVCPCSKARYVSRHSTMLPNGLRRLEIVINHPGK